MLPFVLSPYLRPIKPPSAASPEAFLVDDGVTGWIELDEPMQAVVRAMWTPERSEAELTMAASRFGPDVVAAAVIA
jgi:hypothetical protein